MVEPPPPPPPPGPDSPVNHVVRPNRLGPPRAGASEPPPNLTADEHRRWLEAMRRTEYI